MLPTALCLDFAQSGIADINFDEVHCRANTLNFVNRILFPYLNEAMLLLEEGAEPRRIDKATSDFGMPMGPITLSDLVGLDTA